MLLFHFLKTACDVAERIGVFAVDLFAKDDDAKHFYLKYGFIPLQDDPFHLYLPMATVRAMFASVSADLGGLTLGRRQDTKLGTGRR